MAARFSFFPIVTLQSNTGVISLDEEAGWRSGPFGLGSIQGLDEQVFLQDRLLLDTSRQQPVCPTHMNWPPSCPGEELALAESELQTLAFQNSRYRNTAPGITRPALPVRTISHPARVLIKEHGPHPESGVVPADLARPPTLKRGD